MAALSAAAALTSTAQVFSVNMVGYINQTIPAGFGFTYLVNQLDNKVNGNTDNRLITLFPGPYPNGTTVVKGAGVNLVVAVFDSGIGNWGTANDTPLNPGDGFIFGQVGGAPAIPITFVGEVHLQSAIPLKSGFNLVGSVIPQAGYLFVPASAVQPGQTVLEFGIPTSDLETFSSPLSGNLQVKQWNAGTQNWGNSADPGPIVQVGQSFSYFIPANGVNRSWTRNFSVGP